MELLKKIKEIILKLWTWLISLFVKNKKVNSLIKRKSIKKNTKKTLYKASINRDDENDNVIKFYDGTLPRQLELINNKLNKLRKKIIDNNDEYLQDELNDIKIVSNIINNDKNIGSNFYLVKSILDETLHDKDLELNANDKISDLREIIEDLYENKNDLKNNEKISNIENNLEELFNENLNNYEKNIIKKAYFEYDKVNYVIVTTMIIDDIYNDLQKLNEKSLKNQHSKDYFLRRIKEIEEKIERLKNFNDKKEVEQEIENLKNDLYTKRKDKYDLLYNNEIFTNLKRKCDDIIVNIETKEIKNEELKRKKQIEEKQKEQLKKQEIKKELEKKKEELIEEQKEIDNIKKRFMDLELARQILLMRELIRLKKDKKDLVKDTLESYQEFLNGENHQFNFSRNRIKTEVAKLYNDTLHNICIIEKTEYIPVEHINIKLSDLVSVTLENQERLNNLIETHKKVDVNKEETSIKVNQKLNYILEKEKVRENNLEKAKVYKKEYQPVKKKNEDNNQKSKNNKENLN